MCPYTHNLFILLSIGPFNKVYRLLLDDRQTVIARIPSSRMLFGGASWITASQVATLDIARHLNMCVPNVLSWSKDPSNPVGSPYIIFEDIPGVSLNYEWLDSTTRGSPVAKLLTSVANHTHQMTLPSFSQLGSLYFVEDYPSTRAPLTSPLAGIFNFEHIRIGPITDFLWWRFYHDEPDFDRGPFNTVEEYVMAAVRLERRAVERHKADPSSLAYTNSSLDDLDEIISLLDGVEALVPRIRDIIALSSPSFQRFMQNVLMHPNLSAANIMVPDLNDTNAVDRMSKPTLLDWSGATVLPLAFQFRTPPVATYRPNIFLPGGVPLFEVIGTKEVPFPDLEDAPPEIHESVSAEHRLAMRNMRWIELVSTKPTYAQLYEHPIQACLNSLSQSILRSCADGPLGLRVLLVLIQRSWQEPWGSCPFEFSKEEMEKHDTEVEKNRMYELNLTRLMSRVGCTRDGWVPGGDEEYESAVKELTIAKQEWSDEVCGGSFPFEEGRWGLHLR